MTEPLSRENVQSYPRPPVLEQVPQTISVHLGGEEIVSTRAALRVLETHHAPTYYIPFEDVRAERTVAAGRSFCEWKGTARYWTLSAGGVVADRCAWDYPEPNREFGPLRGHVAIYAHAMDACYVGDERVVPQPGSFYGGWITANLTGTIKGAAGTEGW